VKEGIKMTVKPFKQMTWTVLFGIILALPPLSSSTSQESVAEMVLNGCKQELVDYCSEVTPTRGRIAACLLAHNDQLSGQCEVAFEVGLVQLTMILSTINYVVEQCADDLDKHCDGVVIGGGLLQQCLSENREQLEPTCQAAFKYAEESLE
jgi:hypothetical protein